MTWCLRISAALNLGLLVVAALVLRPAAPNHADTAATTNSLGGNVAIEDFAATDLNTAEAMIATNAFRWEALESTNFSELVSNLRAVRCPELTIRDIVYGDAERRYALLDDRQVDELPFWLAGRARAEASRVAQTNRTAAQIALITEVSQLFGVEWAPEENETQKPQIQALARMFAGPASDAEYEYIWRWFLRTMNERELFSRSRQNLLLQADLENWVALTTDRCTQLKQALNPATFEEFQARTAFMEEAFSDKILYVRDLELTPAELRQLSLLKIGKVGWLNDLFRTDQHQSKEDQETAQLDLVHSAKSILSPEHYEEFLRVQDDDYRELLDITRDNELARPVARQIYEIRQLATEEYWRLRALSDDPSAVAAAAELQQATATSVRKLLGEDAFKRYASRNGKWVNDLGKL